MSPDVLPQTPGPQIGYNVDSLQNWDYSEVLTFGPTVITTVTVGINWGIMAQQSKLVSLCVGSEVKPVPLLSASTPTPVLIHSDPPQQ